MERTVQADSSDLFPDSLCAVPVGESPTGTGESPVLPITFTRTEAGEPTDALERLQDQPVQILVALNGFELREFLPDVFRRAKEKTHVGLPEHRGVIVGI